MNLIIAAHPDDELFGMLGTLQKYKNYIQILFVCNGLRPDQPYQDDPRFLKAKEYYNFHIETFDYLDTTLSGALIPEISQRISNYLKKFINLENIFINTPDLHLDHRVVNEAVKIALRGHNFDKLLEFNIPTYAEVENNFVPNYYVKLSDEEVQNGIMDLINLYKDEIKESPHPQSIESLRMIRNYYGSKIGTTYAECFKLILGKD